MKRFQGFTVTSVIAGFLVLAPLYLTLLILLKAMVSLVGLIKPFANMLPDWLPAGLHEAEEVREYRGCRARRHPRLARKSGVG